MSTTGPGGVGAGTGFRKTATGPAGVGAGPGVRKTATGPGGFGTGPGMSSRIRARSTEMSVFSSCKTFHGV